MTRFVKTALWVLLVALGVLVRKCSSTATFQVDFSGAQKRNLPLSSIIDYRQTSTDTVKNVNFVHFSR